MKLSVSVTNYSWPDGLHDRLATLARHLDHTAVDTLWVADHMMQADPSSKLDEPMLEAYTTLGYLAAVTSRLRLGTMVTAAPFRAPALLIKAVTTLDVLSDGRAWLGIGAGYNADEARATGLFLPETAERFDRLTELLALARQMWSGDETPYRGEYVFAAGTSDLQPTADELAAAAGADRRHRRAAHVATGRAVRRRVQPLRHPRRRPGDPAKARRAGPALRRCRSARRGGGTHSLDGAAA